VIAKALEKGVEFIAENGGGAGVRMKKRKRLIFYSEVPPPIWGPNDATTERQKAYSGPTVRRLNARQLAQPIKADLFNAKNGTYA
jgi:hypothetical protein